jgi:hypothetical protein
MAKWSIFKKLKPENEDTAIKETKIINEEYEQTYEPLAEYKEILYTNTKSSKKKSKKTFSNEEIYWRDVDLIEKKIDKLHITRAQKPTTEVDKTVDKVIQKSKKK